ncbi:MAG: ABC transporter ATP-binding protein [Alphaproteobacteria bacterium]|nr:MAG: ABC transporter ATP-binding protein [Alphaproteobacteria bacterium]
MNAAAAEVEVLRVAGVVKTFGAVRALDGIDLSVRGGQLVALIGPNGAGKSTCFNVINGQLRPDAGRVWLNGAEITALPPRAIWRRGVGRTFQVAATFGSMTVAENIQMVLASHRRRLGALWPRAASLYRNEALALLERIGIDALADRPCDTLAYGDVKRVELAMALAHGPRLLLMDEPTAGMAPAERAALMNLVAAVARRDDVAVLFTEHDMDVVFAHADRVLVLHQGTIIAAGPPDAVRTDPQVRAIYLGALAEVAE